MGVVAGPDERRSAVSGTVNERDSPKWKAGVGTVSDCDASPSRGRTGPAEAGSTRAKERRTTAARVMKRDIVVEGLGEW